MSTPLGYAVVDTETTGIHTGYRHRIAEIAVVHVGTDGTITDNWSTLVNPERDLGPQAIHGITAAEVRNAPRFADLAGEIVERLRGRVPVAHNWPFDANHLRSEFERLGIQTPFTATAGLCTMAAASKALVGSGRSLIACCRSAGLGQVNWHTARDDALAASALLQHLLACAPRAVRTTADQLTAASWPWPSLAGEPVTPVSRAADGQPEPHFLARLVDRVPRAGKPVVDSYLAMLDDALLDRLISATEADALLELAYDLGLHRDEALAAHRNYLRDLARAALADGVVTDAERADLQAVATLLGLAPGAVNAVMAEAADGTGPGSEPRPARPRIGGLACDPGDRVVLTGDFERGKALLRRRAEAAGLCVTDSVSRKTRVVVAADPDSLSGKAKKARSLRVPIVTEAGFLDALDATYPTPAESGPGPVSSSYP